MLDFWVAAALEMGGLCHHIQPVFIKHSLVVLTGRRPTRRLRQRTAILVKPTRTSLWVRRVFHISLDCFPLQVRRIRLSAWQLIICAMATDVALINLIESINGNKLLSPHSQQQPPFLQVNSRIISFFLFLQNRYIIHACLRQILQEATVHQSFLGRSLTLRITQSQVTRSAFLHKDSFTARRLTFTSIFSLWRKGGENAVSLRTTPALHYNIIITCFRISVHA